MTEPSGAIRVGIGGWVFPPWRRNFYPEGLAQKSELDYASRRLSAIEINATYHRLQKPSSFAKWRDATPPGFVFSVKGSQYVTNRRVLGEAGEAIGRFMASGLAELGPKLGPIVWQFATTKVFDPVDFEAFLKLLPGTLHGQPVRHAVEVRHPSFTTPEFLALVRRHRVATVFADSDKYPSFVDSSGDFFYTRLMMTESRHKTGYAPERIRFWAEAARRWARGEDGDGLPRIEASPAKPKARDVSQGRMSSPSSSAVPRSARRERRRRCSPSWASRRRRCPDRQGKGLAAAEAAREARVSSGGLDASVATDRKAATARITKTTNRILAMPAAPAAMPPKPNSAAIRAITKKTTA